VRILVVDDQPLAREAIREFLSADPEVDGLYTACDGRQAVDAVDVHRPDVVLIDIGLPDVNGLSVARRILRLYPETAVVMLGDHDNPQYRQAAAECGAAAFVAKQELARKLLPAISSSVGSGSRDLDLDAVRRAIATPPPRRD
jgi:DNA-binding NarL/FixJ family response regulator